MSNERNVYLTPRETEILKVIKKGHTSNQEIAAYLLIKINTVKNHLTSIYKVLGLSNSDCEMKVTALSLAISLGLIDDFEPKIDIEQTKIYEIGLAQKE